MSKFINKVKDAYLKAADWVAAHPHATLAIYAVSVVVLAIF